MTNISVTVADGPTPEKKIISLFGELDETAAEEIKKKIDPLLQNDQVHSIVLNLKDLEYINSKGIGFLVFLFTHLSKTRRQFILAEAQESVLDVMSLVGLNSLIPYFEHLEEALV